MLNFQLYLQALRDCWVVGQKIPKGGVTRSKNGEFFVSAEGAEESSLVQEAGQRPEADAPQLILQPRRPQPLSRRNFGPGDKRSSFAR